MLLARRTPPTFAERVRVALWPRRSWRRSISYAFLRLKRLQGSPHTVALGFAVGVFACFPPWIGLQFFLAVLLARLLGGSVVAALVGTFTLNPLTLPLIWGGSYALGNWILGRTDVVSIVELGRDLGIAWSATLMFSPKSMAAAVDVLWPHVKPWALGSVPFGLLAAVASYYIIRRAVATVAVTRRAAAGLPLPGVERVDRIPASAHVRPPSRPLAPPRRQYRSRSHHPERARWASSRSTPGRSSRS